MGNRAVITDREGRIGVYLHWNGGRDSVAAFLAYAKMKGYRRPEKDDYGWARLCQIVCNFFPDGMCVGVGPLDRLDVDNFDNGTYIIEDWEIVDRFYYEGPEQDGYDLAEMLYLIDARQPAATQMGRDRIDAWLEEHPMETYHGETALKTDLFEKEGRA